MKPGHVVLFGEAFGPSRLDSTTSCRYHRCKEVFMQQVESPVMQGIEARSFDLRAMAEAIVPIAEGDASLQNEIVANFKQIYADLDAVSQKKILLFFKALRVLSFLRSFRDWRGMNAGERHRFFAAIESFPVGLIRAGFFGLRSLILLSYYSTQTAWQRIGYEGPLVNRSIYANHADHTRQADRTDHTGHAKAGGL
ncbi:MAG: hypothetical protein F9K24_17615 [Leptonema illini]|uniref:Uncharacterized protein n=1 Tax=Leptonema illini TaxID=183 RepID=A0A833GYR0_9LEPT|nr:MAG: hypothetical protein F9K24_17615 [Leptonema illini]